MGRICKSLVSAMFSVRQKVFGLARSQNCSTVRNNVQIGNNSKKSGLVNSSRCLSIVPTSQRHNNKKNFLEKSNNTAISSRNLRTSTILFDEIKVVVCPALLNQLPKVIYVGKKLPEMP